MHGVTALELGSSAGLWSTIHLDLAVGEQGLDRAAGFDEAGQFEQLPQSDPGIAHRYFFHATIIA